MSAFFRLLCAEILKLRRSHVLRLTWLLPALFIALDLLFFKRKAFTIRVISDQVSQQLSAMPLKSLALLWAGFFHPMLLAVLPALLFRPEHRYKTWKHLQAMPVSRRSFYLSKVVMFMLLLAASFALAGLGLWIEWTLLSHINPVLEFPFPWLSILKLLAWMYLGSLPLLTFYVWFADRIDNGAVLIAFGLVGLILTASLSGAWVNPSWKRDLLPWVLPYAATQQAIDDPNARQEVHLAGAPYRKDPFPLDADKNVPKEITLKSGKKIRIELFIPDELKYPPPPTPRWLLVSFSLGVASLLLGLGLLDAKRCRP